MDKQTGTQKVTTDKQKDHGPHKRTTDKQTDHGPQKKDDGFHLHCRSSSDSGVLRDVRGRGDVDLDVVDVIGHLVDHFVQQAAQRLNESRHKTVLRVTLRYDSLR